MTLDFENISEIDKLEESFISTAEVNEIKGDKIFFVQFSHEQNKFKVLVVTGDQIMIYSNKFNHPRWFSDFRVIVKHANECNAKIAFLHNFKNKKLPELLENLNA